MYGESSSPVSRLLLTLAVAGIAAMCVAGLSASIGLAEESESYPPPGVSTHQPILEPDKEDSRREIAGELIVVTEEGISSRSATRTVNTIASEGGETVEGKNSHIKTVRFDSLIGDEKSLEQKAEEISRLPGVRYAEPNGYLYLNYAPNDPYFSSTSRYNQGNLKFAGLPRAWSINRGSDIAIGFVDSGITPSHRDITRNKVIAELDPGEQDDRAQETFLHGTSVASIAAASTDDGVGMAGAGFDADIAMCKGLDGDTVKVIFDRVARCTDWLQKQPRVKVINMSLGRDDAYSRTIADEIEQTQHDYGKAVIVSAGNTSNDLYTNTQFPANLPGVIGVGSNDGSSGRSPFSVRGPHVDLMAPGNGQVAAVKGGGYTFAVGTSFSAPVVSGCVALMYSEGFTLGQIRNRLFTTATDMGANGYDTATGYGSLNCAAAIGNGQ